MSDEGTGRGDVEPIPSPIPFRRRSTDRINPLLNTSTRHSDPGAASRHSISGPTALDLGTVELIASPFRSFRDVGRFQQVLASIPGVRSVHPRQLGRGALHVRVECQMSLDLSASISAALARPVQVVSQAPYRLEIVLSQEEVRASVEGTGA